MLQMLRANPAQPTLCLNVANELAMAGMAGQSRNGMTSPSICISAWP